MTGSMFFPQFNEKVEFYAKLKIFSELAQLLAFYNVKNRLKNQQLHVHGGKATIVSFSCHSDREIANDIRDSSEQKKTIRVHCSRTCTHLSGYKPLDYPIDKMVSYVWSMCIHSQLDEDPGRVFP